MITQEIKNILKKIAKESASHAYAPYSQFHVGCALLGTDHQYYHGCNVENASFGATICAERTAVGRAVSEGCQSFIACAVYVNSKEVSAPCGICRQVLAEFSPELIIILFNDTETIETTLKELLPMMFSKQQLTTSNP